jgi:hypothetical protein
MQKVRFSCEECEVTGTVRLPDDCDDYRIEFCPCCGSPMSLDSDDDDE